MVYACHAWRSEAPGVEQPAQPASSSDPRGFGPSCRGRCPAGPCVMPSCRVVARLAASAKGRVGGKLVIAALFVQKCSSTLLLEKKRGREGHEDRDQRERGREREREGEGKQGEREEAERERE